MKQTILLKARWLLCGLLAVFLTTNAWAETYTIGWGTASGDNSSNFNTTEGTVTGILSFSSAKESSSNNPAYNSNSSELRLYYNAKGEGGSITLTPATGVTITGFVMTTSTSPSVNYSVDGGTATSVSASNNTYTVTDIEATSSLKIQNVNTSNTQLRIKTIEVTYTTSGTPAATLESIAISGYLDNKTYETTDVLDITGLTVTGTYNNSETAPISTGITWQVRTSEAADDAVALANYVLTAGQTSLQVQATVGDVSSEWYDITGLTVTTALPKSTLTFTAACNGSGTADDNVVWEVESDGTESTFDTSKGIHYGTGSNAVQYIKLSTNGIIGTIKEVVVNTSAASGVSATASVTVGGVAFGGDAQTIGTNATDYTFTGSAIGAIEVTITKESSATKALYVKSIVVTYETTPIVTVDPASLTFAAKQNIAVEAQQFTLTGANLESVLTLAASTGYSVSPTSISAADAMAQGGVVVTVTPATPTTTTTPVEGTVTISGGGLASNVVVNLSMAVTPTYAVEVAVNDNTMGSATINGGTAAIYVTDDEEIALVATPASGYEFVNWTVTDEGILLDNSNSASTTAIAGASGTITANFQAQGCTGLAAPTLNGAVAVTYNSATINWNAVANAEGYVLNIKKHNGNVAVVTDELIVAPTASFEKTGLEANTQYDYSIMAMGDGSTYCDENNALLEGNFTTADYPSVAVTYSENGNLVSGDNKQIMTAFALPTEVSYTCSKQFVGWTTVDYKNYSDATNAPAVFYAPGAEYTITENADVTLYAVYATVSGGGTSTTNISYSGNTGNLEESENVAATLGLDANSWTVIAAKGSASNNVGVNQAGDIRLYYNVNGSNTLTITAPQTITSVALTFTGDSYNNAWVKVGNETVTLTDGVYPINNTTFVIGNANTSNVQVRISNIAVNFASAGTASNYSITCTEQVEAPVFGLAAGTYYEGKTITLTCATEDATIYYTTDGSTPSNTNGTEYTAAISLNERAITTIKAIAVKAGMDNSEVTEAEYNINLPYTFTEFAALEKENNKEYAVMGIVSSKYASLNGSNLTYAISADGTTDNEISCYKGLKLNKATFESADDINLGDNVTVVGTWSTQYSNLNANNWMLAYTARVHQSYAIAGELTNSAFNVGDAFDATILNNLYVVETFTNDYVEAVEGATLDAGDKTVWAAGETTLTVYAKLGDEDLTNRNFAVTVSDATLVSIALKADDETYQTKTLYYEGQTLVLPTIVATLSDNNTIEAEATYVSGFDNTTAGVQIVTVSFERGGITETTTYNVTIIQVFNNEDAPHTVADAKAMIEASAYQQKTSSTDYMWVRGIVVSAPNSSSTYTISDDGTSTDVITVWQGKYFSSSVNAYNHVKAGDKVILKGTIVNYDGTKPELTSSQVIYQLRKAWLSIDNVDNFEVGTADLAAADLTIGTESTGEISFASEDETIVSIVDNKLHAVAPGTTTITANMAATANDAALNYAAVSNTFSVTVIAAQTRYEVTFAANGGEGDSPVMEDQLEGATFNLPANTYTYAGHKFTGWSDGTATYAAGAEYTMPAEAVTFTAQWTVDEREAVVFVFTYNGSYYAMGQSISSNALNTFTIDVFNGRMLNVEATTRTAITWYKSEVDGGYTFQTADGQYLTGVSSKTNLSLSSTACTWTYDATTDSYGIGTRTLLLYRENNTIIIKNYAASNVNKSGYSGYATIMTEYVDGTVETLREGLEAGKLGTLCWNKKLVEVEGAVLYDPEYPAVGQGGVGFIETTSMEAGKPFVFQASGEKIRALVTGEATLTPGTNNGLVGVFEQTGVDGDYIVYQNRIHRAYNSTVAANRAYLVMDDIIDQRGVNGNAPARRRLVIGQPSQTPTGDEQVNAELKAEKVVIDGRIYIRRGEKMYNLNGQQVR